MARQTEHGRCCGAVALRREASPCCASSSPRPRGQRPRTRSAARRRRSRAAAGDADAAGSGATGARRDPDARAGRPTIARRSCALSRWRRPRRSRSRQAKKPVVHEARQVAVPSQTVQPHDRGASATRRASSRRSTSTERGLAAARGRGLAFVALGGAVVPGRRSTGARAMRRLVALILASLVLAPAARRTADGELHDDGHRGSERLVPEQRHDPLDCHR